MKKCHRVPASGTSRGTTQVPVPAGTYVRKHQNNTWTATVPLAPASEQAPGLGASLLPPGGMSRAEPAGDDAVTRGGGIQPHNHISRIPHPARPRRHRAPGARPHAELVSWHLGVLSAHRRHRFTRGIGVQPQGGVPGGRAWAQSDCPGPAAQPRVARSNEVQPAGGMSAF